MGRKLNLSHLSEEECENILKVIQRDFELRQKEKERLGEIEEEVSDETTKTKVLAKQKEFNENCCMRCFGRFFFIFNQKVQCSTCDYFICKSCGEQDNKTKKYTCNVCAKQKELQTQTCSWFYTNIQDKFKRFGSAKVVRSLYKRKTDSDSENESSTEAPHYVRSVPIGKRSRHGGIQGLFDQGVPTNGTVSPPGAGTPPHSPRESDMLGHGAQGEEAAALSVVEDDIVAQQRMQRIYQSPYTCTVATGQESFDQVRAMEVERFSRQLNGILDDLHRILDNGVGDPLYPSGGINTETYNNAIKEQTGHISASLSTLTQSLHIAIDNQNPTNDNSQTARHQLVTKCVQEDVEKILGEPLQLAESTSEHSTVNGSSSNDSLPQQNANFEDRLADAITNKVMNDHRKRQHDDMQREEADVRRKLTKLSNQATLSQLADFVSESETDEPQSSARASSRMDETLSDVDSRFSEVSDPSTRHYMVAKTITMNAPDHTEQDSEREPEVVQEEVLVSTVRVAPVKSVPALELESPRIVDDVSENAMESGMSSEDETVKMSEVSDEVRNSPDDSVNDIDMVDSVELSPRGEVMESFEVSPRGDTSISARSRTSMSEVSDVDTDSSAGRVHLRQTHTFTTDVIPGDSIDGDSIQDDGKDKVIEHEWAKLETINPPAGDVESHWRSIEARASPIRGEESMSLISTTNHGDPLSPSPVFLDEGEEGELTEWEKLELALIGKQTTSSTDSNYGPLSSDLARSPVQRPWDVPEIKVDGGDYSSPRGVPLPSFDGSDSVVPGGIDLDDISRTQSDEEGGLDRTWSSEITFGSPWKNLNNSGSLFNKITPYDNSGEKKLGRHRNGPVMMLVPSGEVEAPKVGEDDIDQISDLSENEERSDASLGFSTDSDSDETSSEEETQRLYEDYESYIQQGRPQRRPSKRLSTSTSESCVQTDHDDSRVMSPMSPGPEQHVLVEEVTSEVQTVAPVVEQPAEPVVRQVEVHIDSSSDNDKARTRMVMVSEDELDSDDADEDLEGDPHFVKRPDRVITAVEGEKALLECVVAGTEPVDVFWYRDTTELVQLDEDERCEACGQNGQFQLTMYSTLKSDAGRYICIAVNELGQKTKRFRLAINENKNEKRAPEFLKGLPNIECNEGDKVQFRCKVTGYPQPLMLWYKDGKRIKKTDDIRMEKSGNRDYILTLDKVTMDDDAEFMAVAKNIAGNARSAGQLMVEEGEVTEVVMVREQTPPGVTSKPEVIPYDTKLYPAPDELLRLADSVAATRGQVGNTAEDILDSADKLSSIHSQLDEMDRKLHDMEGEVHSSMTSSTSTDNGALEDDLNNNEMMAERNDLVQEHDDMNLAASNIRELTSTAVGILTTADHLAEMERDAQGIKRKSELLSPSSSTASDEEEEVQVRFTYTQFETLYEAGLVSKHQMRQGRVKKRDLARLEEYLAAERKLRAQQHQDVSHDLLLVDDLPSSIDCGLKKVDSKRYKRDYVVNKNGKKAGDSKWEVQYPSAAGTEIVRSDSTNEEDPTSPAYENELYLTAGKVFTLEERIRQLESQVESTDGDTSAAEMSQLEDEVARSAARVSQSDRYVARVEQRVWGEDSRPEETPATKSPPSRSESQTDSGLDVQSDSLLSPSLEQYDHEEGWRQSQIQVRTEGWRQSPILEASTGQVVTAAPPLPRRQQSVELRGSSDENAIPEVRVESDIDLPSVKNLMSRFSHSESNLNPDGTSVKRVYSLTGRDLPRTVREKLKKQTTTSPANQNIRTNDDGRSKLHIQTLFEEDKQPVNRTAARSPELIATTVPAQHNERPWDRQRTRSTSPESTTSTSSNYSSRARSPSSQQVRTSSPVQHHTGNQVNSHRASTPQTPPQTVNRPWSYNRSTSSPATPAATNSPAKSPTTKTSPKKITPPKRGQGSSSIMARAAFWNKRIEDGEVLDEKVVQDFPNLTQEAFKSGDHPNQPLTPQFTWQL